MFGKRKVALSALAAGATLVVVAPPAIAAAEQFKFNGCETSSDVQMCGTNHVVVNKTLTPSGNVSYVSHMTYDLTFTFAEGDSFSATGSSHYHELVMQDEFQEFSLRQREVYTNPTTGTCYVDFFYHYANGELQFDKTEISGSCP